MITFLYSILSSQSQQKSERFFLTGLTPMVGGKNKTYFHQHGSHNDKISFHFGSIGQFIDIKQVLKHKLNVLGDLHFCRHATELLCPIQQL